jgi:hypothetical protein
MYKKLFFLFALGLVAFRSSAQDGSGNSFSVGSNTLNAGVGFGGGYNVGLLASLDHGFMTAGPGTLSLGGVIGIAPDDYTYVAARATYVPDILNTPEYNVYAAFQLGFQSIIVSDLYAALNIGGRYYFTKNLGAFAEIGVDIPFLKMGVSYNF